MKATRQTVTLFAAGAVVLAVSLVERGRDAGRLAPEPTAVAERRRLEVSLVEPGTLQAARSVVLSSEIRSNRAKIVFLVGDGARVKAGDEVVRFDPTPFEEERARLAAEARDAEAAASRAEQERKLEIAKAEEALDAARYRLKIAELELESYQRGSGALNVREAEVRAAGSGSELERARQDLADVEQMFGKGFVSEGELARQRLKVAELERQNGLQRDRLRAEREVIFPRDLERARTDVRESKEATARAEAVLYHTREFYDAAVASADRKVETAAAALRAAADELAKTVIRAPLDGFVVLQEIPLESGKRKPQVGDSVWSGQPIAMVPDLSRMIVLTRVREIDLHRIREGLEAAVAVEAYPDLGMKGAIDFIGSIAEESAGSPWKFFTVRLVVDRSDPRLRPGMSVRASFLLDAAEGVVVVPADAVFADGDRLVCYVRRGGEVWKQPIVAGKRNDTHVEVQSGVRAGEEVLLAVPDGPVRRVEAASPNA